MVRDFNSLLTPMDRSAKQKIRKDTQTLNDTIDQLDLTEIYTAFHPKTMDFTFFSSAHTTLSRTNHILGHKSSLGKLKKIEIISSIFSNHSAVKLDINYREKLLKLPKLCWIVVIRKDAWDYFNFFEFTRLDLWPRMWSILENVLCALEKKVKFIVLGWSNWSIVSFEVCVSLLIFCLGDLSIGVSRVLKSPTIIVLC